MICSQVMHKPTPRLRTTPLQFVEVLLAIALEILANVSRSLSPLFPTALVCSPPRSQVCFHPLPLWLQQAIGDSAFPTSQSTLPPNRCLRCSRSFPTVDRLLRHISQDHCIDHLIDRMDAAIVSDTNSQGGIPSDCKQSEVENIPATIADKNSPSLV